MIAERVENPNIKLIKLLEAQKQKEVEELREVLASPLACSMVSSMVTSSVIKSKASLLTQSMWAENECDC